jgi:hypothetical protein
LLVTAMAVGTFAARAEPPPVLRPLLSAGEPVDWWFVFKFNARSFPGCPSDHVDQRQCLFGGEVQHSPNYEHRFSQQFAYASSSDRTLRHGAQCAGASTEDPLGATFAQVHQGPFYYVVWNDQFDGDPKLPCGSSCSLPWAHSKGLLAWGEDGQGLVLQVSTPSWPGSGSSVFPRKAGNTLGCISSGNNVMVSQHFFALRLTKDDVVSVLKALRNARVVTAPSGYGQIVRNGGPVDVQDLVISLGTPQDSSTATISTLSSGVRLISKPAALHVPPWQMVSALLGATPLRVATWWQQNRLFTTRANTVISCWDWKQLGRAGAVEIATSGQFDGHSFGLVGGPHPEGNHAKLGVSIDPSRPYSIFGDMNQEGGLRVDCTDAQNPRGGLFYVVEDRQLFDSMTLLLAGGTAPDRPPPK